MKNRYRLPLATLAVALVVVAAVVADSKLAPVSATAPACAAGTGVAQECAKCEGQCKGWIDQCKEGGQRACYKAAACLCKCNLDAGGCGSDRNALKKCYEDNEKLARDLESPPAEK